MCIVRPDPRLDGGPDLRLVSRVLLRAPLLPVAALGQGAEALAQHPLGRMALELASSSLARLADGGPAAARYARRAAFRPTPSGLLAGVAVGGLGPRTRIATGEPAPYLTVAYARLSALARALLDEPEVRTQVRLRRAPSLVLRGESAVWLAPGKPATERAAEVDAPLARLLATVVDWTPWALVRDVVSAHADEADELLLAMLDDSLLTADLVPPLVGPPPLAWTIKRLAGLSPPHPAAAALVRISGVLADGRCHAAEVELAGLPGAEAEVRPLHAVLVHRPRGELTLSRVAVERAVGLAGLLLRAQAALVPPAAERYLDPAVGEALSSIAEVLGTGALDVGALTVGDYGVELPAEEPAPPEVPVPRALMRLLVDRMVAAAAAGEDEVRLSAAELDDALPLAELPPTFELVLSPCREERRAAPGSGWLLGLHAPAGASWGRFAHAIGAPLTAGLAELARLEATARPGEERLDVAFSPSSDLGDLAAHPPVRTAALALSSWPEGEAVTLADLELVADELAHEPLALRRRSGAPVSPSPLSRLRSTTAPAGAYRLLAGWSLVRQHAPWALQLGALGQLSWLPRVSVDGFVVSPASWRVPDDVLRRLAAGGAGARAALRRYRARVGMPRLVQVGHEDELLPIDLDAPGAPAELARLLPDGPRVHEIWPPVDRVIDADGRRVEAIVAVVAVDRRAEAAITATASAGRVQPPPEAEPAVGWRTWKLFGGVARQDRVLAEVIGPVVTGARAAGEIDRWMFVRYVEGPGTRHHLRLRVHASGPPGLSAFETRLAVALEPSRRRGDVVSVESAEYHREVARYGGRERLGTLEQVFESDSTLCLELLDLGVDWDPDELVVRSLDALARGFGLDVAARWALASRRRAVHDQLLDAMAMAAAYRSRQRRLRFLLGPDASDEAAPALAAHQSRVASVVVALAPNERGELLPAALHLASVRLVGPDREKEASAYYFWERTLKGLVTGNRGRRGS